MKITQKEWSYIGARPEIEKDCTHGHAYPQVFKQIELTDDFVELGDEGRTVQQ